MDKLARASEQQEDIGPAGLLFLLNEHLYLGIELSDLLGLNCHLARRVALLSGRLAVVYVVRSHLSCVHDHPVMVVLSYEVL